MVAAIALAAAVGLAGDLHFVDSDRTPVGWQEWLDSHGPTAVLVWASWAPGADECSRAVGELRTAAGAHGLDLVIVAVQEGFDDAAAVLERTGAPWLHDRHGAILKEYRLIEVPGLIVVDGQGRVQAKLDPTPGALAEWRAGN